MSNFEHGLKNKMNEDKITWLAKRVFTSFPDDIGSINFSTLDCGCIYFQRVFPNGSFDSIFGAYRSGDDGPCRKCREYPETWKDRSEEDVRVYAFNFQVE